VSNAESC